MHTKHLLSLLICCMFSIGISAQSYSKMWKDVEKASTADTPISALKGVNSILTKANAEGNKKEILRAWITSYYLQKDISADSAKVYLKLFEEAIPTENNAIFKALFHSALGICYQAESRNYSLDNVIRKKYKELSLSHFELSLAQPEALVYANVKDYLPLFTYNEGSKWFGNDLLHILFKTFADQANIDNTTYGKWADQLVAIYTKRQMREAALLITLNKWQRLYSGQRVKGNIEDDAYFSKLASLYADNKNLKVNVQTANQIVGLSNTYGAQSAFAQHNDSVLYHFALQALALYGKDKGDAANTLRNFKTSITLPAAKLEGMNRQLYPQEQNWLRIKARNVKNVVWRITPLCQSTIGYESANDSELRKMLNRNKHLRTEQVVNTPSNTCYTWTEHTLIFDAPKDCGIYRGELWADGQMLDHCTFSVSRLGALSFKTGNNNTRIAIIDKSTGHPVTAALLTAYKRNYQNGHETYTQLAKYQADANGYVVLNNVAKNSQTVYAVSMPGDKASALFSINGYTFSSHLLNPKADTRLNLFTDRGIYRPGQKVDVAGVMFTQQADDYHTESNKQLWLRLSNAQNKAIDSLLVSTDSYGSFSGQFSLPMVCLPGSFSIVASNGSKTGSVNFKVESYKRPTFTVTTLPLKQAYALGDSVRVQGIATTYSGLPVSGARVIYTIQRSSWRFMADDEESNELSGEGVTDNDGHFSIPLTLRKPSQMPTFYNRYFYTIRYTLTAPNGETAQGETTLSVGTKAAYLAVEMPNVVYREKGGKPVSILVKQLNATGENIDDNGTYQIKQANKTLFEGHFSTGKSFGIDTLKALPSGVYQLIVCTPKADTDTLNFTLIGDADKHINGLSQPLFFYEKKSEQTTAYTNIVCATNANEATLFCYLVANDSIIESKQLKLNGYELKRLQLTYKPEYGNGATLYLTLVKDGKVYTQKTSVVKPQPDKRLLMQWTSFRSKLTPGQKEVWKLKILHPDGTPAKAQMMACLYDASLDALSSHNWQPYGVYFNRTLPTVWQDNNLRTWKQNLSGQFKGKWLSTHQLAFTTWNNSLFSYPQLSGRRVYNTFELCNISPNRAAGNVRYKKQMANMADFDLAEDAVQNTMTAASRMAQDAGNSLSDKVKTRKNFAETAFFRPCLETDQKGNVSIAFTLPESMTQWNFKAMAHDEQMNNARIDTNLVVRKDFMVEPSLPRFLRKGDVALLPVNVTNLTNKAISATVEMVLTTAEGGTCIFKQAQKVSIEAGRTNVCTFSFDTHNTTEGMLVCKTMAQGNGFSDGEENYLPILTNQVEVVRTLPFTLTEKGIKKWQIDTLFDAKNATHRTLTVEGYANPTWLAAMALPALVQTDNLIGSNDWATQLYALALGHSVVKQNPALQQMAQLRLGELQQITEQKADNFADDMPWLQQAEKAREQALALSELCNNDVVELMLHTAMDKLKAMQDAEGAFSWYPGMRGNPYTTIDIATLLARIERLTEYSDAHAMLSQALTYLKNKVAQQVKNMKENEQKSKQQVCPSEWLLRYLYLNHLTKGEASNNNDVKYLVSRAKTLQTELTMYGKAVLSLVMADAGKSSEAEGLIKSMVEHTVCTPTYGRYFDSERAQSNFASYRIATQCAAIEALQAFGKWKIANEMKLWLMQAKRTQMWETLQASTDAIYTLLATSATDSTTANKPYNYIMPLSENTPLFYTLSNKSGKIVALNAASEQQTPHSSGYFKQTIAEPKALNATTLKVDKRSQGTSWGCVYASYMTNENEVSNKGAGLSLTSTLEVKKQNKWVALAPNGMVKKGDIVRQVFCIIAQSDFDFVELASNCPACFNPLQPLSGHSWQGNLPIYKAIGDSKTQFFVEKLNKGTHHLYEEYVVAKEGTFSTGTTSIKCVYAPEFNATSKAFSVNVIHNKR